MTLVERLNQVVASGDLAAYSSFMEEFSNWTARPVPGGIGHFDPYGDQDGDPYPSFEDLLCDTFPYLERAAELIDSEEA